MHYMTMDYMNHTNHTNHVYATKRRRRNSKCIRVQSKEGQTKSNPSKRHRERLNSELDMLASLLPYDQSVLSKLDKLSILRLSVSYLRTKSYFQAVLGKDRDRICSAINELEGDLILQALNGFLLILTCDGEVFYSSHTVETYLGFHQSDICHQSVYELVHSEDREELQRHLMWNSALPSDRSNLSLVEGLLPENWQYLERNFTVRFRCLLDNTSGFLRLDIRGRIKVLHGQNHKSEDPPLALFAVCTPFGPPSLLEMPQKESMFKSRHKLDFSIVSMDPRGKQLLGYSDQDLVNRGGYDLVHYDDLAYVASAHQELLKTGASGLIAYRLLVKDSNKWQWLQTSARLQYKNSKPEHIMCTHRPLMEEEGRDLLGKRTMDFKVTYLDGGLSSSSSSLSEKASIGNNTGSSSTTSSSSIPMSDSDFVMRCQRNRKYKSQMKDNVITSVASGGSATSHITSISSSSSHHRTTSSTSSSAKRKSTSSSVLSDTTPLTDPYTAPFADCATSAVAAVHHAYQNSSNPLYNPYNHHPPPSAVYTPYNHTDPSGLSTYCSAMQPPNLFSHLFPSGSLKAENATRTENGGGLSHLFAPTPSLKGHDTIQRTPSDASMNGLMDHHSTTRPFLTPDFLTYSRHALGTYYPEAYSHHPHHSLHTHHPHSQYATNGLFESASY